MIVSAEQVAFAEHAFWAMYRHEVVSEHVQLPSLGLMGGHQVHCPKLDDAAAIRYPNKQPIP